MSNSIKGRDNGKEAEFPRTKLYSSPHTPPKHTVGAVKAFDVKLEKILKGRHKLAGVGNTLLMEAMVQGLRHCSTGTTFQ